MKGGGEIQHASIIFESLYFVGIIGTDTILKVSSWHNIIIIITSMYYLYYVWHDQSVWTIVAGDTETFIPSSKKTSLASRLQIDW